MWFMFTASLNIIIKASERVKVRRIFYSKPTIGHAVVVNDEYCNRNVCHTVISNVSLSSFTFSGVNSLTYANERGSHSQL